MLVLEKANFDTFHSAAPGFRSYLNTSENKTIRNTDRRACTAAALHFVSGGKLGGAGFLMGAGRQKRTAGRAVFAARWERMVLNLLQQVDRVRDDPPQLESSKVSFAVEDYTWKPPPPLKVFSRSKGVS